MMDLPRTSAPPIGSADLRTAPEDFEVTEILPFALTGSGEHLWLKIRKRGANTDQVCSALARAAGISRGAVGSAGLKDRHAVAVQWFSLHLPGREDPNLDGRLPAGCEVVNAVRHGRKLQTGAHSGNEFRIVLRQCRGDLEGALARWSSIEQHGVPNYFGEQRFGRDGDNVERAREMFRGSADPGRHRRGIYLSAARSQIFNTVLAERVAADSWNTLLNGEACALAGSRSFFVIDGPDQTAVQRLAAHDIHPSGPLWGRGDLPTRHAALALEQEVAAREPEICQGLERAGLKQERRPLRLLPRECHARWVEPNALELRFVLPAGSFATTVVRELAEYRDVAARGTETEK